MRSLVFSRLFLVVLGGALLLLIAPRGTEAQENFGAETGLPLPRWAALDGVPTRARVGPGRRYAVAWQYHRRGLPILIVDEFEYWRLVRDWEGAEGWVHRSLLKGQARFQVVRDGAGLAVNRSALAQSAHFAEIDAGVVGDLLGCAEDKSSCEVRLEDASHGTLRGWLRAENFYGGFPPE